MAQTLIDRWIARRAEPDVAALAAVSDLEPAVVVTGATRGIGRAMAQTFAAHGHTTIIVARDDADTKRVAEDITAQMQKGVRATHRNANAAVGRAIGLAADVTAETFARALTDYATSNGLYVDTLINNAGFGLGGPFAEQAPDALDALTALNVAATTRLTRAFLPEMLARGRGGVINLASLGAYAPGPHQAAYYASKAYVLSFTEAVGQEIAGRGVRMMAVAPGPVETQFHATMGTDSALYRRVMPQSTPDNVARAAYRAYRLGRRVVCPGLVNTALMLGQRVTPHPILLPLMARLLRRPER